MSFELPKNSQGIPLLGIGSGTFYYKSADAPVNPQLVDIFSSSVKQGLVHLDSAECYGNDRELKETLSNLASEGVKREDIFITDKYYIGDSSYTTRSSHKSPYDRIKELVEFLGTPYVDLYLLHSPFVKKETHGFDLKEAWLSMIKAYDEGLVKLIGVSNFAITDIEEIWNGKQLNPQVNQIEFNAFLQNQTPEIVEYCQTKDITIEAYSPLAPLISADLSQGPAKKFDEYLSSLAEKYGKTKTQILLKWVLARGIIPITTTSKTERLEELKGVFGDWKLEADEVEHISKLGAVVKPQFRKYWKPEYSKFD